MMDFDQWLSDRNIDCQTLTPELEAALLGQYEAECRRSAAVTTMLVVQDGCLWPLRSYWMPVSL